MIGNSDDETNFLHKLLLTNGQVENHRKDCANYLSADIKLSKSQLPKIIESSRFLGKLLGPLLKLVLLMENMLQPLAKSALIPLRLTAAALAVDVGIHLKKFRLGNNTTNNIKRRNRRPYENSQVS